MPHYDIAIIGGGLVGTAAAISAARNGYKVAHLAPKGPPDRRTSALMQPSVDILTENALLDAPQDHGTPLTAIRIIDATSRLIRAPETLFDSSDIGKPAFGWNFANAPMLEHFDNLAAELSELVTISAALEKVKRTTDGFELTAQGGEKLTASLLVGADGKRSFVRGFAGIDVREHPHHQSALVCDLTLQRPLNGTSVEFHYENGPFTLVPAGADRANLVWIDEADKLAAMRELDEAELQAAIQSKSRNLFGRVTLASRHAVFPLSSLSVETAGSNGVALIGEAAHAFPPIGAQGLNLGLRDLSDLLSALAATPRSNSDWPSAVTRRYAEMRSADLLRTGAAVDALFQSLLAGFLPAQALRAGGLWALKLAPPIRRAAMAFGMGKR